MSAEPRRGSSLFSGPGSGASNSNSINKNSNNNGPSKRGDIGGSTPAPLQRLAGGASRRGSSVLQPGALDGIGGLGIDFDDSDYSDDDDSDVEEDGPGNVKGQAGTGGPNHRPYVGGFAAAAYEAARAHHNTSTMKLQVEDSDDDDDDEKPSPSKDQEKP